MLERLSNTLNLSASDNNIESMLEEESKILDGCLELLEEATFEEATRSCHSNASSKD